MERDMNFILIGYRGTGKTSVGKKVAAMLGLEFCDTDEMILTRTGKTVAQLVEKGGWELFREKEREAVRSLPEGGQCIMSLGGGAVLDRENIEELKRRKGVFIWLYADEETIRRRIGGDKNSPGQRPPLGGPGKSLRESITERTALYRGLADFVIDTSDRDIDEIVERVCLFIKKTKSGEK